MDKVKNAYVEKAVEEAAGKPKNKPYYKSKKWWTAILAAAIPAANGIFKLGLETEQVMTVVLPLIAYVIGEAWVDSTH